jgi:hypothetical protein
MQNARNNVADMVRSLCAGAKDFPHKQQIRSEGTRKS